MKRAIFIGWQEDVMGFPPIALFNVVTDDKQYPHGTTVDTESLSEWKVQIPRYPDFKSWKSQKEKIK